MSARARRAAPSERRSHAERTAETRERVMAAVVESIADVGYQKTTAAEIARRAEVTWGAVQHHFGDKDGILMAVLDDSFERFAERLGQGAGASAGLDERVGRFIDRAWEHFSSPHYRSMFEILLNLPPNPELAWQRNMLAAWRRTWSLYFPDVVAGRRETIEVMHYTVAVLSGLATMKMLAGDGAGSSAAELGFLKQTLVRELSGAG